MSFGMGMLLCAALAVSAGCADAVRLDDADNGGSVTLAAGDSLEVVLESNPTTGYSWRLVEIPDCLEQEGDAEYDSDAAPGMVGAGGEETWVFTAVEPGEGSLTLEYTRPWEEESDPAGTFEIEVVVE
jgi:inhibitor of cysteine peptidase